MNIYASLQKKKKKKKRQKIILISNNLPLHGYHCIKRSYGIK
jgi:hypothetical protein